MKFTNTISLCVALTLPLVACGSGDDETTDTTPSSSSSATTGSSTGAGGSGGGDSSSSSTSGGGGEDPGAGGAGGAGGGGLSPVACEAARDAALGPIDKVSTGEVIELDVTGAVKTLYIDASAGGTTGAAENPWIYLSLATGARVDVSDPASFTSTAWDLGLKRALLRTNSGDGGPGEGGAIVIATKTFDEVTKADAVSATIPAEAWFDDACELQTDQTGAIATTFLDWYAYNEATHQLDPKDDTYVVRGGDGALYKLQVEDYYANADGTSGMAGGKYKLKIAALP